MPESTMKEIPIFSVITVSYNTSSFIAQAISSVLRQSYKHFEYIVIDDNSSDNSWQIITEFSDPRLKACRNKNNLGEYNNRNRAIEMASGRYIIFIDGDDYMYHNALETFLFYIKQFPECSMIFTREWDRRIIYPYKADARQLYQFEYLDNGIMGGNFTKVLIKKSAIIDAGLFPTHISTGDTYIQLKIALTNSGVAINDGLTWWRSRSGNATDTFFKNNRHHAEIVTYRTAFLDDPLCPLNDAEKHIAKNNIYGLYLRSLVRMVFKLQWVDVLYLFRRVKVPFKYYSSVFLKSRHNYFSKYNGDNPLHTEIGGQYFSNS